MTDYLSFPEAIAAIGAHRSRSPEHDSNFVDLLKLLRSGALTAFGWSAKEGSGSVFAAVDKGEWASTWYEKEWYLMERPNGQLINALSLLGSGAEVANSVDPFGGCFEDDEEWRFTTTLTMNTHHGSLLKATPKWTGLRIPSVELENALSSKPEEISSPTSPLDGNVPASQHNFSDIKARFSAGELDILKVFDELSREGKLPCRARDRDAAITARLTELGLSTYTNRTIQVALKKRRKLHKNED